MHMVDASRSQGRKGDYSSTPLTKKLGLKAGSSLLLVGAPAAFIETLGPLPEGIEVSAATTRRPIDVAVIFCTKILELDRGLKRAARTLKSDGALWIAWPKKTSGIASDLDFDHVQRAGLSLGL